MTRSPEYAALYAELDAKYPKPVDTRTTAQKLGWSFADMADYFDVLTEHTKGMSHPERVAWLANEINWFSDDEELTTSKRLAWEIIAAWEAENARLDEYARRSFERQWAIPATEEA